MWPKMSGTSTLKADHSLENVVRNSACFTNFSRGEIHIWLPEVPIHSIFKMVRCVFHLETGLLTVVIVILSLANPSRCVLKRLVNVEKIQKMTFQTDADTDCSTRWIFSYSWAK